MLDGAGIPSTNNAYCGGRLSSPRSQGECGPVTPISSMAVELLGGPSLKIIYFLVPEGGGGISLVL